MRDSPLKEERERRGENAGNVRNDKQKNKRGENIKKKNAGKNKRSEVGTEIKTR